MDTSGTILQIFASPGWGGGEQFVYDLSRRLLDDGRKVILVSRPSDIIRERVEGLGAPYHTLQLKGVIDPVSAVRLARLIVRYRPEIIHVHHFKDAFTAAYARLLSRASGLRPRIMLTRHLVRRGKRGGLYRWLYGQIDRIAFVSDRARREFLAGNPKIDPSKLRVIHNSVPETDSGGAAPPDLRRQYNIAPEVPLLLFSGRLVEEKGCDILLEACSRLGNRPWALVLAGAGDDAYVKQLREWSEEKSLFGKVFFTGFLRGAKHLLTQADISVSPSIVCEAGSLTVLEAMQAGRVQVASDNGAQPEYIAHGKDGLLVPPADAKALAEAIARLLDDKALRERMGCAAREKFDRDLSYERFYERYLTFYT